MATVISREQRLYVPLLKGKQGEFRAILNLSSARNHIIPLIEHEPCSITDASALKKYLEEKYIPRFIKTNFMGRAFVDLYHIRNATHAGTLHPLELVLDKLRTTTIQPTPVVGPHYPVSFVTAVKKAAREHGVCIRLRVGKIDLFDLLNKVNELLATLEVSPHQIDLLLDFGPITSEQEGALAFTAVNLIRDLNTKGKWRTFTLASGAFPLNLEQVKGGTHARIKRSDWTMWQTVAKHISSTDMKTQLFFGDYAVNHPDFPPSSKFMTIVPALRYTLLEDPHWLALKESKSDLGNRGFFDLCRRLVRMPEYAGRGHCWADDEIYERSLGRGGPGNAGTWREYGTVHHITTVVEQLANFRVP